MAAASGWGEVAGALIGGFAEGFKSYKLNQAASSAAGDAQNFAQFMANTTYRRAVRDLRLAGLNPALAYAQGGSPSPNVGAADVYGPEGLGDLAMRTVSNVQARQELNARLKIMKEEAEKARNDARRSKVEADVAGLWSPRLAEAEWRNRIAASGQMLSDTFLKNAQRDVASTSNLLMQKDVPFAEMKARVGIRGLEEFGRAERNLDALLNRDVGKWASGAWERLRGTLRDNVKTDPEPEGRW